MVDSKPHSIKAAVWILALTLCAAACGPKPPKEFSAGERGQIAKVFDDGRLRLADGLVVRLAAIDFPPEAPVLAPEPGKFEGAAAKPRKPKPPLYKTRLMDAAMGRPARLFYDGRKRDARGAALAHIYTKTEAGGWIWLQEDLVREGAARVRATANDKSSAKALLAMELEARKAKKGLWADPRFSVRAADSMALSGDLGRFTLVEGIIQSTSKSPARIFLNFGADFRTDFTASIPEDAWSAWPGGGADLLELKGAHVRVRGLVDDRNGPSIEVTNPDQLELLPLEAQK